MFYVDLDPKINNKKIYEIRYINNAVVTVEPPRKVLPGRNISITENVQKKCTEKKQILMTN